MYFRYELLQYTQQAHNANVDKTSQFLKAINHFIYLWEIAVPLTYSYIFLTKIFLTREECFYFFTTFFYINN